MRFLLLEVRMMEQTVAYDAIHLCAQSAQTLDLKVPHYTHFSSSGTTDKLLSV